MTTDKVTCVSCGGSGEWSLGSHSTVCYECDGSGKMTEPERHNWRLKHNTYNCYTTISYNAKKRYNHDSFFDLMAYADEE